MPLLSSREMTDSKPLEHPEGWDKKMHYSTLGWCWCGQSCPCCRALVGDTLGACEICLRKKQEENVSRYYQKQFERFMKNIESQNIKEAFVPKEPDPEPEEETMYTRIKKRRRG